MNEEQSTAPLHGFYGRDEDGRGDDLRLDEQFDPVHRLVELLHGHLELARSNGRSSFIVHRQNQRYQPRRGATCDSTMRLIGPIETTPCRVVGSVSITGPLSQMPNVPSNSAQSGLKWTNQGPVNGKWTG